ncbi:MAG: MBL fold metallo-hydrolase [Betaproteobacteria bacterium]|nr:MBL fold metallo-hydrolase [Betaproteobacteria bacterium]
MHLQFIGSGDAFGSGGRFNTCFHVKGERANFLIDCGASSLIALKRWQVDLNAIRHILITHFHADHFGGIPFFMLDAQFFSKRTEPLTIAGPAGLGKWYERFMETSFPGSSGTKQRFELSLVELTPRETACVGELKVTPFQAIHGNPGGPFFAYRIEAEGRTLAYTGDTEWTDELIEAGRGADLFIAEAYFYDKKVKLHLDLASLAARLPAIQPRRLVLTHMSDDMLSRLPGIPYETAEDGKVVEI